MFKAFLVKYAEIGIKGKNRYLFEDALIRQMEYVLKPVEGTFHVTKEQGSVKTRIWYCVYLPGCDQRRSGIRTAGKRCGGLCGPCVSG